jgi:hypothetical protein
VKNLALTLLVVMTPCSLAEAQGAADGAYGRLTSDVILEGSLGGGATFEADTVSGAATLELRARYLDMAGLMVGAEWRPEGASRVLVMVDLRPVFLIRFLLNASFHDRYWDLFVDSIGLDLGVAVAPLDDGAGGALAVGFGFDVPLVFFGDGVEGMGLRLFGRHVAALATDRLGPNAALNDWIAGASLVFRAGVTTGLPGWEPRRYRLPED